METVLQVVEHVSLEETKRTLLPFLVEKGNTSTALRKDRQERDSRLKFKLPIRSWIVLEYVFNVFEKLQ